MIQLPFHLPPLSIRGVEQYIKDLEANVRSERIPEPGRQILALGLPASPRQIKRTLNLFHVLNRIAKFVANGELKYPIAWPLLIKTIVIQAHFSKLYQEWNEFPILVSGTQKAYRTRPTEDNMALSGTDQSLTI